MCKIYLGILAALHKIETKDATCRATLSFPTILPSYFRTYQPFDVQACSATLVTFKRNCYYSQFQCNIVIGISFDAKFISDQTLCLTQSISPKAQKMFDIAFNFRHSEGSWQSIDIIAALRKHLRIHLPNQQPRLPATARLRLRLRLRLCPSPSYPVTSLHSSASSRIQRTCDLQYSALCLDKLAI